jgi:hypothetical protein
MYKLLPNYHGQPVELVERLADKTFIPFDPTSTDYQAYLAWLAEGNEPLPPESAPPPTPQQIQSQIVAATQDRLDAFAQTRNYGGILSACTYATSTNPKFAAEGQYCVETRDATWAKLYEMLDEVLAGTRPMPSGYADIEPELPVLEWPDA